MPPSSPAICRGSRRLLRSARPDRDRGLAVFRHEPRQRPGAGAADAAPPHPDHLGDLSDFEHSLRTVALGQTAGHTKEAAMPRSDKPKPQKQRQGLPDKSVVVAETTMISPKGASYRILKSSEKYVYEKSGPPKKRPRKSRSHLIRSMDVSAFSMAGASAGPGALILRLPSRRISQTELGSPSFFNCNRAKMGVLISLTRLRPK